MAIVMRPRLRTPLTVLGALVSLTVTPLGAQQIQDTVAVRLALAATSAWLAMVDGGKAGESWDAGAPAFQAAVTKADWIKALTSAREPFEPFGTRTILSVKYSETMPRSPPGPYIVIQYLTRVSRDREVIETVATMRTANGSWRVAGYVVRPNS